MKIGVKTYHDEDFLGHFKNKCDFFEVQAIQKNDYDFLKNFKKPMVIHAEHQGFGVNACDSNLHAKNLKSIKFARKLADFVSAKKIILHAGMLLNDKCSKEVSVKFVKNIKDNKIIIENHSSYEKGLCSTPEKMREFLDLTGKRFCLDINHAISSAKQSGANDFKIIKDFIKMKPAHYHLGGQKFINFFGLYKKDVTHLSFLDSEIDLKRIVKLIPSSAMVTLETAMGIRNVEEDLGIMKKLGWKGFNGGGKVNGGGFMKGGGVRAKRKR